MIHSLQVATPFITLVIFYYMAMRIDLTSQGRFGQVFVHFRFFFIASPAHLAIIAALRGGYKLVSQASPVRRGVNSCPDSHVQQHANRITPYIHMWTDPSFQGLFVAQKLGNAQLQHTRVLCCLTRTADTFQFPCFITLLLSEQSLSCCS
jgi:hypothetical protein